MLFQSFGKLQVRKNAVSLRKWSGSTTHLRSLEGTMAPRMFICYWGDLYCYRKFILNVFLSSEKLYVPNKLLSQKLQKRLPLSKTSWLYSLNSVLWLVSRSTWFRSFTFVDIKILCDAHQGDESSCARDAITYFFQIPMRISILPCYKFERTKLPRRSLDEKVNCAR